MATIAQEPAAVAGLSWCSRTSRVLVGGAPIGMSPPLESYHRLSVVQFGGGAAGLFRKSLHGSGYPLIGRGKATLTCCAPLGP